MTLSSVLTSLTRSSPTLTTPPSSGAVSTKRSVFHLLLHPPGPFVVTALALWTNNPSSYPLLLPHPDLLSGPSYHVNSIVERTFFFFLFSWGVECFSYMGSANIYICLIMFLPCRGLKLHVMWESFILFCWFGSSLCALAPSTVSGLNTWEKSNS